MSRKTIKVDVPIRKPSEFSKLCNDIIEKHIEMGVASPLNKDSNFNQTKYQTTLTEGDQKRKLSEKLKGESETAMEQARTAYGSGKGQTAITPDTMYNYVIEARDYLLSFYKTNPEMLEEWGFPVVVGTAKSPTKKKP